MVKRTVIDHLSSYPSEEVYQLLNEVIRKETQHDLVATALESLGHIRHPNSYRILVKQLDRESFRDGIRYATLQGLTHLGDVRALRVSRAYMAPEYLPHVRLAALNLRYSLSRTDPTLISLLQKLTSDRDRNIRRRAWAILGTTGKTSAVLEFIEQALKSHQARDIRSAQQNALKAVKSRIAQRKKAKLIL